MQCFKALQLPSQNKWNVKEAKKSLVGARAKKKSIEGRKKKPVRKLTTWKMGLKKEAI